TVFVRGDPDGIPLWPQLYDLGARDVHVQLDWAFVLHARRILSNQEPEFCPGRARHGHGTYADLLSTHSAQQSHAGDHHPTLYADLRHWLADRARLSGLWPATTHAFLGRTDETGPGQP